MLTLLLESALRSLVLGGAVWIALKAFRARNARTQALAWVVVLAASLLMPVLMRLPALSVTVPAEQAARIVPIVRTITLHTAPAPIAPVPFDWRNALAYGYLAIAALLLVRLAIGFILTARLWRRAVPLSADWTAGMKVRSSADLSVPVTFGSTILIPEEWPEWDDAKRKAVVLHEKAHVEHHDFYLQVLAGLHRAVFWFNPLSWFLVRRIAELSEAASDDAAIEQLRDRPSYAEILLEFARMRQPASGVAMARPATVSRRVDRILSETVLHPGPGLRQRILLVACMAPIIALAAVCTLQAQNPTPPQGRAQTNPPKPPAPPAKSSRTTTTHSQITQHSGEDIEPFAIVHGDSITVTGSNTDMKRAKMLQSKIQGDYIWFERDLKFYYITDAAMVARAKELFRPEEEIGNRQGELGELQGKLGEEQGRLGEQQAQVIVSVPEVSREMEKLVMQIEALRKSVESGDHKLDLIGELQGRLGEIQGRLGELQTAAGEKQAKIGEQQAKLGEQQAKLGEQQARLGERQARLAEEAMRKLRVLLDDALRKGLAKPVEQ